MTPEGKEKAKVKDFLATVRVSCLTRPAPEAVGYYHMAVPMGYGSSTLDFTGCYRGRFFAIETKAHDTDDLSPRQKIMRDQIEMAGGMVFWGCADRVISEANIWFRALDK